MNRQEVKDLFLFELRKMQGTILEVGFGKHCFYQKYSETTNITGVELSHKLVIAAEKHLTNQNKQNSIKVYKCTDDKLPFNDNYFDCIVLSFCFCCLKKPENILTEICRVAKNNGLIISFDHVRSAGIIGLFLDMSTPLYALLYRNCHLNRNPMTYFKKQNIVIATKVISDEHFTPWLFSKCIVKK